MAPFIQPATGHSGESPKDCAACRANETVVTPAQEALQAAQDELADAIERDDPNDDLYQLDQAVIRAELDVAEEQMAEAET